MDLTTHKQANSFPSDLDLATTLVIVWLLDKPLAAIAHQLKVDGQDLAKSIKGPSNPIKRFLLLYMSILRKNSKAFELQAQRDELKSLIIKAKDLNLELEKRGIRLPLPIKLDYLENLVNG